MKKFFVFIFASLFVALNCAAANEGESNSYLPKKGDWAVGVDFVPLFRTIGGAFNTTETPIGGKAFDYDDMYTRPDVAIMGKYMVSDKWSLNVTLGVNVACKNYRNYVVDDAAAYLDPLSNAKVVDKNKVTKSGASLMIGAEYRLGQRRVQGIFGVGLLAGLSGFSSDYTYGNKITELNQRPSTAFTDLEVVKPGYRVVKANSNGLNGAVGVYGSMGAEWMVAKQVAIGAKVDLYLYGAFSSNGYVKSEGWNDAYKCVDQRTDLVTPGNWSINFGTDNIGASLYCMFYF